MIVNASHTGKTEIDRRQESVKNVQKALVNRRSQWAIYIYIYIHCTVQSYVLIHAIIQRLKGDTNESTKERMAKSLEMHMSH